LLIFIQDVTEYTKFSLHSFDVTRETFALKPSFSRHLARFTSFDFYMQDSPTPADVAVTALLPLCAVSTPAVHKIVTPDPLKKNKTKKHCNSQRAAAPL
jgi:hypothetical protein